LPLLKFQPSYKPVWHRQ